MDPVAAPSITPRARSTGRGTARDRGAAMSLRRADASAPTSASASRLQRVLEVGAALQEPDPTGVFGFSSKPKSEAKPEPSAQATTVVAFLERFWYKQDAEEKGMAGALKQIKADLYEQWQVVQETIRKANMGRTSAQSRRVTPTYHEALWLAASATAGDATWGEDLDTVKRIGMRLWAELDTLPEKPSSVVLGRLVACNWWWHRFETDPRLGVEQDAAAAARHEARLRELHDLALKAFRGQYEAGKKGKDACSRIYTKCTHVDFTFEEMMNTVKARLLITEWGREAMWTKKQHTPPPQAYAAGPALLDMYSIKG